MASSAASLSGRGWLFWWATVLPGIVYASIALAIRSGAANPLTTLATAVTATVCSAVMIVVDAKRPHR